MKIGYLVSFLIVLLFNIQWLLLFKKEYIELLKFEHLKASIVAYLFNILGIVSLIYCLI